MGVNSSVLPKEPIMKEVNFEGISVGKEKIFVINTSTESQEGLVRMYDIEALNQEKEFTIGTNPRSVHYNAFNGK